MVLLNKYISLKCCIFKNYAVTLKIFEFLFLNKKYFLQKEDKTNEGRVEKWV